MRLKLLSLALCLSGSLSSMAFADSSTVDPAQVDQLMQKITARTQQLEQQVQQLRAELKTLKKQKQQVATSPAHIETKVKPALTGKDLINLGATPVTTAPYIGVPSAFDASTQITTMPTYNTDVTLLRLKQTMAAAADKAGFAPSDNPSLILSGKLEPEAIFTHNYPPQRSNIDLTTAEFDLVANMNAWVTAFAAINYDNTPPIQGPRESNSKFFLNKGFVTFGNFTQSPFYLTVGQRYIPYGHYSSFMISNTLPQNIFRTKARAALIGFQPMSGAGVYANGFAAFGDTNASNNPANKTNTVNQFGSDIGYIYKNGDLSLNIGGSAITNIADADGMQNTGIGGGSFSGFGSSTGTEVLQHRVPGYNIHTALAVGDYTFFGEFNSAIRSFSPVDLSFNGKGARPTALQVEGGYNFNAFGGKPTSFAIGYNTSSQALGLNQPKQRYISVLNVSFWKDTIESLEFHHDINYAGSDYAGGNGGTIVTPTGHHSSDTLTAQFGIYF